MYSLTGNRNFARKEELIYETIAALTFNAGHLGWQHMRSFRSPKQVIVLIFDIPLIFCSLLSQPCSIRNFFSFWYLSSSLKLQKKKKKKKMRSPWSQYTTRTATCFVCSTKLSPVRWRKYFSKAILRRAKLQSLCNVVFVPHFAMAVLGHPHKMFHFPSPSLSWGWVGRSGKEKERNDHLKGSGCQGRPGC